MGHIFASGSSVTVTIIVIVTVLRGSLCTDLIHGRVSRLPRPPPAPPLPSSASRSESTTPPSSPPSSSPSPSPLPSSLTVDVTLEGTNVHLEMQEDPEFESSVPAFELFTDSQGRDLTRRVQLKDAAKYSVYHDAGKEADFMVFQEKDENGTSQYRLEGFVHLGGKLYDLKTTGKRFKRRRKRDTGQPSSSLEDSGEEEEEEFEVTAYSAVTADEADYEIAPPSVQKTRDMTEAIRMPLPAGEESPPLPPPSSHDPLPPPRRPSFPPKSPFHRWRRQVTQDVYVDVVVLADYGVYQTWYNRSNKTTAQEKKDDALEKIRRYYAFVMNGVAMLYKDITSLSYKIHVKLASVYIATTPTSSNWTEQFRVTATLWDEVNASEALEAVSGWASTTDILPPYDHLMVFTGYDLSKNTNGGGTSDKITGLAYTATVCETNGKATSIVEDLGGFQCIGTAAHELGHGLSAEHDGKDNDCRSEDRYVMAAGTYEVTPTNKLNPWAFSSCSVNYFENFFSNRVRTGRGRTCLHNALGTNSNIPDVSPLMEGQLYDADEQCRQVYGSSSRLCRGPEFGNASDVCTDMFCYDPTTRSTCYQLVAARGTTCGNRKWCRSGQCVSNSAAPAADDNCVFGDQPGTVFDSRNCAEFVGDFTGYCYQEVVRVRCCGSCANAYRLVRGCEYGNNATGCSTIACPSASVNYLQSCCQTCNYGSTFTTPTTTTPTTATTTTSSTTVTTTPTPTTTNATGPTSPASTTTKEVTSSETTTNRDVCVDNTSVTINTENCSTLVSNGPQYCYDSRVISLCCQSCQRANTGVAGCEFGDRNPTYCSWYGAAACSVVFSNDFTYSEYCCDTCGYLTSTAFPTTTRTTSAPTSTTTTSTTKSTTTPTTSATSPPTTTTTPTTTSTTTTTTTTSTTTPPPTTTTTSTTSPTTTSTTKRTTPTSTTTITPRTTTTTTPTTSTTSPTTSTTTTNTKRTTPTSTTTTTTTPRTTTTTPTTSTTSPTTTSTTTTTTKRTTPTSTTTTTPRTTTTTPTTTTSPTTTRTITTQTTRTTTTQTITTSTTTPTTTTSTITTPTTTSTTVKTATPTTTQSTSSTSASSSIANTTTTTTMPVTNGSTGGEDTCVDAPSDSTCTSLSRDLHLCYDANVLARCCVTCTRLADTSSPGCEYGDRRSDCSAIDPKSDACRTQQPICCKTCAGYVTPTGGQSVTADVIVHVILFFVILSLSLK